MGNCISLLSPPADVISKKDRKPLPIQTMFKFPSPLPTWPTGGGFGGGTVDLGGLRVCQITSFSKVWATHEGGPDNVGASFFEPSPIPEGFFMLGCYSQPNNRPLFGWVLCGEDATDDDPSGGSLKQPTDYTLVWSSEGSKIDQDGNGYIWLPTPPDGYRAVGHLVTSSPEKPSVDKIRCVRSDFTDLIENHRWIWGLDKESNANGINIYGSRPTLRGTQALGVSAGTFVAQNGQKGPNMYSLKNVKADSSSMPDLDQIQKLVQAYSPWIYFHPDEQFFPSSVSWFFENGALLYQKGNESNPIPIEPTGSNLPQGGSNDGSCWLDLPIDSAAKDRVKRGDLQDAGAYLHIKPMFGATFTDIAIWVFYPFNGSAKARVEFFNVSLGKIGEHVGDWEHVTLRVSNFNGQLTEVYFSQHSKGVWVSSSELEFQSGNKAVVYSSLHGHAAYPNRGANLQGKGGIGIRNDTAKGKMFMDTGVRFGIVSAEHLGKAIIEPAWLNYAREWGPKISYDIADELRKVEKLLPGKLKREFEQFVKGLPNEVLGEEGPTGPKWKDNWAGDERA